jgi:uncharacterized protein YjdB
MKIVKRFLFIFIILLLTISLGYLAIADTDEIVVGTEEVIDNSQNSDEIVIGSNENESSNDEQSIGVSTPFSDETYLDAEAYEYDPEAIKYIGINAVTASVGGTESIDTLISKFSSNGKAVLGVDVSAWQDNIDWQKVASSGVKFAMIRCGYRGFAEEGNIVVDARFKENIEGAIKNGLYVGVYFFSTAINENEAIQEAQFVLNLIKDYNIKYPVAYDFEYFGNLEYYSSSSNMIKPYRTNGLSNDQLTKNANAFLYYIKSKGYTAAMYGSSNPLTNIYNMNSLSSYDTWVAHYKTDKPSYSGSYTMWQCTETGTVPGINTNVDINVDYTYYFKYNEKGILYKTHIQGSGWEKNWKANGASSGTVNKGLRLEGICIQLNNDTYSGSVQYRTHIQGYGWESSWKTNGVMSGTSGESKRLEAIQIKLTGEIANYYDIYYRVYIQGYGWLGWAKNGQSAGSESQAKRLEAIQIKLVEKDAEAPGLTTNRMIRGSGLKYNSHVQNIGWLSYVGESIGCGTTRQAKRIEALQMLVTTKQYTGGIQYKSYIQDSGWESSWKKDGEMSGTVGKAKRIEALQIQLYGDIANYYDVYYRVYVQGFGWLGWTKNGETAGTTGYDLRIEMYQVKLVDKDGAAPGSTENSYKSK